MESYGYAVTATITGPYAQQNLVVNAGSFPLLSGTGSPAIGNYQIIHLYGEPGRNKTVFRDDQTRTELTIDSPGYGILTVTGQTDCLPTQ